MSGIFPVERSGAIGVSRHPKIFVTAAISKSWAKILPRGHISGHFKISGDFFAKIFNHKKVKQSLGGQILGKVKSFGQHFVPVKTTLLMSLYYVPKDPIVGFRFFPGDAWRAVNASSYRIFKSDSSLIDGFSSQAGGCHFQYVR